MKIVCNICSVVFKDKITFCKHLKDDHKLKEDQNLLKCPARNCDREYVRFSSLSRHLDECLFMQTNQSELNDLNIISENLTDTLILDNEKERIENNSVEKTFNQNNPWVREPTTEFHVNEIVPHVVHSENKSNFVYNVDKSVVEFRDFLQKKFANSIDELKLTNTATNAIYKLTEELVCEMKKFHSKSLETHSNTSASEVLDVVTDFVLNNLKTLDTDYKRNKQMESNPNHVKPQDVCIGVSWKKSIQDDQIVFNKIRPTYSYVPVVESLKSMMSREHVRNLYFSYNQREKHVCSANVYKEFCCSKMYAKNQLYAEHPDSLQLQFFIDSFEVCDPLKPKANKHSQIAIYFAIRNMPHELAYNMENIHLVALCNSNHLKSSEINYNYLWERIVQEIQLLEVEGILLSNGNRLRGKLHLNLCNLCANEIQLHLDILFKFKLCFFLGTIVNITFDNLGGNSCLGYAESFSANFYCRMCEMNKDECRKATTDDCQLYRTKEKYAEIIQSINEMDPDTVDLKQTLGIKRYCVLNQLNHFHILDNYNADIMHDLLEGAVPFVLTHFFSYCINESVFSENRLKNLLLFFDYGKLNTHNIPPVINLNKKNLGQNASQIKCLIQNLPLILYDYRDDEKLKKIWPCIYTMLKILQIVYSSSIKKSDLKDLEHYVSLHLQLLIELFEANLIPKHHMMTHYHLIIEMVGPLVHLSTLRYETKHRQFTRYAQQSNNFMNVSKSLSNKYQNSATLKDPYEDVINHSTVKQFDFDINDFDMNEITDLSTNNPISEVSWLKINIFYYAKGMILKSENIFFEIEKILTQGSDFYFVCSPFKFVEYDMFLNCIEIKKMESSVHTILQYSNLPYKKSHDKKKVHDKIYLIVDSLELVNGI